MPAAPAAPAELLALAASVGSYAAQLRAPCTAVDAFVAPAPTVLCEACALRSVFVIHALFISLLCNSACVI